MNYKQTNMKIYDDLVPWDLLPLDFSSKIRAIKINILPRLLYLPCLKDYYLSAPAVILGMLLKPNL